MTQNWGVEPENCVLPSGIHSSQLSVGPPQSLLTQMAVLEFCYSRSDQGQGLVFPAGPWVLLTVRVTIIFWSLYSLLSSLLTEPELSLACGIAGTRVHLFMAVSRHFQRVGVGSLSYCIANP
jgi:hypothetical protein